MATLNQLKYEIPRRSTTCSGSTHSFAEGMEIVSVLLPNDEGYTRQDLCKSCFDVAFDQLVAQEGLIYWKAMMPSKKEQPAKFSRDERSLQLLRQLLEQHADEGGQSVSLSFVLALYLERRRQLVKRQEKRSGPNAWIFFEVLETGEVLVVKKIDPAQLALQDVQRQLAQMLGEDG